MSYFNKTDINQNELGFDAWGRNKSISDKSMFSGLFTYDVPRKLWKEMLSNGTDYIEQTSFAKTTSIGGQLRFTSGTVLNEKTQLRSKKHVRYQPNRGHLYSASMFMPDPTNAGIRRWGIILPCNGVFFELIGTGASFTFNFVVRSDCVDTKTDITNLLPVGFDFEKGNLYDFQMQWRGVGDFKVFVNLEEIYVSNGAGTRDSVSVENPSLPVGFETENLGDEVVMLGGCVDITSEGGEEIHAQFASFSTGSTLATVNNSGVATMGVRMPVKITYEGQEVCYSRDSLLSRISSFCKDESFTEVYIARGVYMSSLPNITWTQEQDGFIEFSIGGEGSDLDVAFQADKANLSLLTSVRQEKDFLVSSNNPDPIHSPFEVTSDDYIIVVCVPDGNSTAGCTIEMAEQI